MDKLNVLAVGVALAVTSVALNLLCALAVALWPDATLDFFGAFMHGLDLGAVKSTASLNSGRVIYGIVGLGAISFATGVVFAAIYNLIRAR